jgi:hypothetical protein
LITGVTPPDWAYSMFFFMIIDSFWPWKAALTWSRLAVSVNAIF